MFHIEFVTAYPKEYTKTTEVAKNELRAKSMPKLTDHVENMKAYDIIFLGYPIGGARCRCLSIFSWRATSSPGRQSFRSVPMRAAAWDIARRILPKHVNAPKS